VTASFPVTRSMQTSDIDDVVTIHCEGFATSRSTSLGVRFLRKMYRWFLVYHPELAFVAELDGKLVGFVTGAIGGSSRRIFHYAFWEIVSGLVRRPRLLLRTRTYGMWHSHVRGVWPRYGASSKEIRENLAQVKATLPSIGVAASARGRNVGTALIAAFEDAARKQGATEVSLGVERNNVAARRLYEKCGWRLAWEDASSNSAGYAKKL
jgi:ribosomal protein S18 acetylase RimI-like enzyme